MTEGGKHQQVSMSKRNAKTCVQFGCGAQRQSFQLDDKGDEQDYLEMVAEAPSDREAEAEAGWESRDLLRA